LGEIKGIISRYLEIASIHDSNSCLAPNRERGSIEFDALTMRLPEQFMNVSRDIHPLTDFKRHTAEFLTQLKSTGKPVVLTINGKAELIVQDAASYQKLIDLADRLETIQAVKEGLASIERGQGKPMDDVFDALESQFRAKARA
jgi:PHD/YefM family antitoxin component YafN of YafNO toxin-antitoxin module